MAQRNKTINPLELRGTERVFQIDRDTILIYTGLHLQDVRPFSRIGAGFQLPAHLLPYIEHVILPENHLWNTGVEDAWLRAGIDLGAGKLTYVGSKERVTQLNRYFDIEGYIKQKEKEAREKAREKGQDRKKGEAPTELPVKYEVYQAPQRGEDVKNKCLITYLATGDYQVSVGSSKVLDSGSYFRARLGMDREYALMSKVLAKSVQPASKGFGFIPFASEEHCSALWNFNGSLLFNEPVPEYHYRLFEIGIDPDRVSMGISGSVYQPGLIELMRRADVTGRVVGISAPDSEKLGLVKRIFNFAQPKFFSEGGALPLARTVSFFESRTRSHGAFVFRTREDAEHPVQVLFPFLKTKPSRSFDFVKGPYDLEMTVVDDASQLKEEGAAQATLLSRGMIAEKAWKKLSLGQGQYPAVPGCEYQFRQVLSTDEWSDAARAVLAGTEFEAPVLDIIGNIAMATDLTAIRDSLYIIRTQRVPRDPVLLLNLSGILNALYRTLSRLTVEDRTVIDLAAKVASRFNASKLRIGDLDAYAGALRFDIIVMNGLYTVLLAHQAAPKFHIQIEYPPSPDSVLEVEKEYRKYLKSQQKIVDKVGTAEDRAAIEMIEKLFEEALFHGRERQRLQHLFEALQLGAVDVNAREGLPFYMKLPYWLRVVVQTLRIPEMVDWFAGLKDRFFAGKRPSVPGTPMQGKAALILLGLGLLLAAGFGLSRVDFSAVSGFFGSDKSTEMSQLDPSLVEGSANDVKKNGKIAV